MQIEYHPKTVNELNNAILYYTSIRSELGSAIRKEVYDAIDRISKTPELYPKVSGDIRRCLIHRFPFSILYRIVSDKHVRILVIRHHRKHSFYGMNRK